MFESYCIRLIPRQAIAGWARIVATCSSFSVCSGAFLVWHKRSCRHHVVMRYVKRPFIKRSCRNYKKSLRYLRSIFYPLYKSNRSSVISQRVSPLGLYCIPMYHDISRFILYRIHHTRTYSVIPHRLPPGAMIFLIWLDVVLDTSAKIDALRAPYFSLLGCAKLQLLHE